MAKNTIQLFKFHDLKLSEFLELMYLIFGHALPITVAQLLGVIKAYNEAKAQFDKLVESFQRNPALLKTEKLVEAIMKIRRKMALFKNVAKGLLGDAEGERLESAKVINNVAHPYLKDLYSNTQVALAANGMEMAVALRTAENLPLLTQLGLKDIVDEIADLAHEAGGILYARGEEKMFRKKLGNASNIRRKLEKQVHFLLYSAIPVHHSEATGALLTTFEHTVIDINGVLKSFQHLTSHHQSTPPIDNEQLTMDN
ncbi:MAG: DUF6261 family protein [Mediterranea sp.]|jgi:hypothetical protein|nr:DUF6261 family protein [Mediterranea sp.]